MLKKAIRTLQTYFPALLETKFTVQRHLRQFFRHPFEQDFAILKAVRLDAHEQYLDIGSNRGQSIQAIKLYTPNAQIVAFEPNPHLYKKLLQHLQADQNVSLHNFGLGDAIGSFELYIPSYNGWLFDGLASFSENSAAGWLNVDTIFNFKKTKLQIHKVACHVKRLDDFDTTPGFIKIDVQGFEEKVLLGGEKTLAKYHPILFIETETIANPPRILNELGYIPCYFKDGKLNVGKIGVHNTLFFTPDRLLRLKDEVKI